MPDPKLSVSASALLASLRGEGGYWTVVQIVHHWRPTWLAPEVEQLLRELSRAGYVVQRPSLASARIPSFCALPVARATPPFPIGPKATPHQTGEMHA